MGFCSGTDIFDPIVKIILDCQETSATDKQRILRALIQALWDHDWDCEEDSRYYRHPFVLPLFRELRPDWFEDE